MDMEFSAASMALIVTCLLSVALLGRTLLLLSRSRKEFWELQRAYLLRRASTLCSIALVITALSGLLATWAESRAHQSVRQMQAELSQSRNQLLAQGDNLVLLEKRLALYQQSTTQSSGLAAHSENTEIPSAEPAVEIAAVELVPDAAPKAQPVSNRSLPSYRVARVSTSGQDAVLRAQPGGEPLGAIANGAMLQYRTDQKVSSSGLDWVEVRLADGRSGWIAERLLQTDAS